MKIYWRVRTWTFSANGMQLDANDEEVPFSTSLGNIRSGFEGDEGLVANTTEEQLVCGSGFFLNEDTGNNTTAAFGITNPVKKIGDLYGGVEGGARDINEGVEYFFRSIPFNNSRASSTISIFGRTFFIIAFSTGEEENLVESLNPATLTPTLWWSYGGTYDTSTGAPL